jgi:hypothetical protein
MSLNDGTILQSGQAQLKNRFRDLLRTSVALLR